MNPTVKGGKLSKNRRSKRRQNKNQNQNQNQNQNGGSCGNSSTTAAVYGGLTPMPKFNGGNALNPTTYNSTGNANVSGLSLFKGGNNLLNPTTYNSTPVPLTTAGNANVSGLSLFKGGNSEEAPTGGNAHTLGASIAPMTMGGAGVPGTLPTGGAGLLDMKGGNVLNNIAVPAVLLYANNTFGKKKITSRRFRRYRGKRSNKRRNKNFK